MAGFFDRLRQFTAKNTKNVKPVKVVNWVNGRKGSNASTNSNTSSVTISNNNTRSNKRGFLNRIFKKKGNSKNYATNVNTGALGEYSAPYYTRVRNNTAKAVTAAPSFFNKIKRGITGNSSSGVNKRINSNTGMKSSQFAVNSVANIMMTHYDILELINKAILFSQRTKEELLALTKNGLGSEDLPELHYILYRDIYLPTGSGRRYSSIDINDLEKVFLIPAYNKSLDKYYIIVGYKGQRIAILDNNNSFMNALSEKEKQYIREILDRDFVKYLYDTKTIKGVVYNKPYVVKNTENMRRNRTRRNNKGVNNTNRRGVTFKDKVLVQEIPMMGRANKYV